MGDLERLWDDLPVGRAPLHRIRRLATAGSQPPRRRYTRPLARVAVLAAIGGAFLTGTYLGQSPPGSRPGAAPGGTVAFHGELRAAESCDDLLDHYVERGVPLVGPYGWNMGWGLRGNLALNTARELAGPMPAAQDGASLDSATKSARTSRAESSDTGTNVQEAGVDEPDVVKTDGERLFRLHGGELATYDLSGDEPEPLSRLDVGPLRGGEILVSGDTVLAIGRHQGDTRARRVDVSAPEKPEITSTVDFDSTLVTARLHGDTVRLVTSAGLPRLDFVRPHTAKHGRLTPKQAQRRNRQLVRDTTISDWLPTGSVDGGTDERLAECEDVAVPEDELGLDTVSVIGFAADDPATWDVTALAADTSLAYASRDDLYLATSGSGWGCWEICPRIGGTAGDGRTHVFDFSLTDTGTSYVGAGEVDGWVRDRWAMDEQDGVLRLAVSPTHRTGNFNSVVTLRAEGDELVEVGRLDHLGRNEEIKAVRWFDSLAVVVTFRQVDPLYTVDLADPASPTMLGKLKIPGFSEYLHPVGPRRMIGVGQGPAGKRGWAAQAGLFRTLDLADPRRLDTVTYRRGTQANAALDPRQFTWLPEKRIALTVISEGWTGRTGWVSVLSLEGGRLGNRMIEAEHGVDVAHLRLVPLPDGRVVLSTVDDAEFLDL